MFLGFSYVRTNVFALEDKQSKGGTKAYALVQFTNDKSVEHIISLAKLCFIMVLGNWSVGKWDQKLYSSHEICNLNLGCHAIKNNFSMLWSKSNVFVGFGDGIKMLYILLQFQTTGCKLELSNEDIRQIILNLLVMQQSFSYFKFKKKS